MCGLSGYGVCSFELLFNVNLLDDTSSFMSELRCSIACKNLSLDTEYLLLMSSPQTLKQLISKHKCFFLFLRAIFGLVGRITLYVYRITLSSFSPRTTD